MGVFDKIKNALFEEEYVEVEEKPAKAKKEKIKKEFIKEKKEEKPIAKKVVLPEKKETRVEEIDEEELIDEDFEIKPRISSDKQFEDEKEDFKIIEDDDFMVDEEEVSTTVQPQIVKVIEKEETRPIREEPVYYGGRPKEKQPYGINESSKMSSFEYGGAYEKKDEKKQFQPSPIISPIYGILDKNYKKEDVALKKEVRVKSSYARENLNLDDVRKKAFGTLNDDLVREIEEDVVPKEEKYSFGVDDGTDDDSNLLVDLSTDDEKPAVKEVTMGDALEYFQDLGLEYNVDYVDASKEKATGRRVRDSYEDGEEFKIFSKEIEKKSNKDKEESQEDDSFEAKKIVVDENNDDIDIDSEDNLFDLIDSMYKED